MAIYKKGADTAVLRAVAERITAYGQQLEGIATEADRAVSTLKGQWGGGDLQRFVTGWGPARAGLASCRDTLGQLAQAITRNAGQQDDTSGQGGGSGPGLGTNGGRPERDGGGPGGGSKKDPRTTDKLGKEVDAKNVSFADDDLEMADIEQGSIADCWFLSSLGVIADKDPEFIRDHVKYDAATNTYTVTLYDDGDPVEIKVEGKVVENGAADPHGNPNYASIYEKAMAKFMGGSYSELDYDNASTAMEAITGQDTDSFGRVSLDEIEKGLKEGRVYTLDSHDNYDGDAFWFWETEVKDNRIAIDHVYMVDKVEVRDGQKMIHVVNPWGPDGGTGGDNNHKAGDLWLTEQQYKDSFSGGTSTKVRG